jgi:hypothetical protein
MLKNVQDINQSGSKGLNTQPNIFALEKGQSPNMIDVKVNFDGSVERRLGTSTMNSVAIATSGGSSFIADSDTTLRNGMISWWNLDETSGERKDAIGTNHLTDENENVSFDAGKITYAAKFVKTQTNLLSKVQNVVLNNASSNMTISTWVYLAETGAVQTIVSKRDNIIQPAPYGGIDSQASYVFHCEGTPGNDVQPSGVVCPFTNTLTVRCAVPAQPLPRTSEHAVDTSVILQYTVGRRQLQPQTVEMTK